MVQQLGAGVGTDTCEIPDAERIKYSALVAMRRKESTLDSLKQAQADVAKELRSFRWDDKRDLVRG
jgi:hypothetical protein